MQPKNTSFEHAEVKSELTFKLAYVYVSSYQNNFAFDFAQFKAILR